MTVVRCGSCGQVVTQADYDRDKDLFDSVSWKAERLTHARHSAPTGCIRALVRRVESLEKTGTQP